MLDGRKDSSGIFRPQAVVHRVALVERGPLQGRQQEWNISRKELQELVRVYTHPVHHMFQLQNKPNLLDMHSIEHAMHCMLSCCTVPCLRDVIQCVREG